MIRAFEQAINQRNPLVSNFDRNWLEIGFLWRFWTENFNFSVLPKTFSRLHWHISLWFGVEKNDAVVHLTLSSLGQKLENFVIPQKKKWP